MDRTCPTHGLASRELEPDSRSSHHEGQREATGGGGGEREPNQILLQELIYVSSSIPKSKTLQEGDEHTNQQHRNGRLEVMNAAKKE
jgi:hypothetical protein